MSLQISTRDCKTGREKMSRSAECYEEYQQIQNEQTEGYSDWQLAVAMNDRPMTKKEVIEMYGVLDEKPLVANDTIFNAVVELRDIRRQMDSLADVKEHLENKIADYMRDKAQLISADGEELVHWRFNKDSTKFNEKIFKFDHKDLYSNYLEVKPGNRTFLLKNKEEVGV
jgi:hypothetical protein